VRPPMLMGVYSPSQTGGLGGVVPQPPTNTAKANKNTLAII